MTAPNSRYRDAKTLEHVDARGRVTRYLAPRFVPEGPLDMKAVHVLGQNERLDHAAYHHYRDAEAFWRLCDGNGVMWPAELTQTPGRRIMVPEEED